VLEGHFGDNSSLGKKRRRADDVKKVRSYAEIEELSGEVHRRREGARQKI